MSKILITGATGFIGRHIVREFINRTIPVTCLVRPGSDVEFLKGIGAHLAYGDIRDQASLREACQGANWVIHNAAQVKDWGPYRLFYEANVRGSINVMNICHELGIKNVIMTGSNSVYGEEDYQGKKDETFPFNSHYHYFLDRIFPCRFNYYRDTKALATQEATKIARDKKMNLTILEPIWVYGEWETMGGFYEYLKSARDGVRYMPGSKKNTFHVVYAGDLARAFYLAYVKQLAGINRVVIGNSQADTMDSIYTLFCQEAGIRKPKNLPKWLLYPVGFLMELAYTLVQSKKPPLLTRGRINMFYDNIEFSVDKARQLLGFINEYTLEQGIKKTVQWYKDNNLI